MKRNIFILILMILTLNVFATAQYPDKIIYNGVEYALHTNPLEAFFEKNPDKRPQDEIMSSALWRGYVATFEIIDNQLFLKDIEVQIADTSSKESYRTTWKSVIKEVFPDTDKVKVGWMTGLLVLPYGKLKNYVHMGYGSTYSNYILLEISEGNLTQERKFNGAKYEEFKEKQFRAFKKTEEYKKLVEDIKKIDGFDEETIDSFLRSFVLEYTSKILE